MSSQFHRMCHPESVPMREPMHRVHKGRPRKNKRNPSRYDYRSNLKKSRSSGFGPNTTTGTWSTDPTPGVRHTDATADDAQRRLLCPLSSLPAFMLPYFIRSENVKGDGHCGWGSIVEEVYDDEEEWFEVKTDMVMQMLGNKERYDYLGEDYDQILNILGDFQSVVPESSWFRGLAMG